ncbi:TDT family transporter [Streptomyces sp. NPDC006879]|uniref:TDT family transporter n=1 Tax=Streptomyces sp. NPDC006879 TaxID=3364767 RepID=UPI0036B98C26
MTTFAPSRVARTAPATTPRLPALRHLGPNWYASIMGTAMVANAGATLPYQPPGLRELSTTVWALSAVALAVLLVARAGHWLHHRDQARAHLLDPTVAPFYGCLAMALLAVGGGALLAGRDLIGTTAAVAVDAVLFTAGTTVALFVAAAVPYLMITRHTIRMSAASPVWLLPVVAPMVSAALGPLLIPHLPTGQARLGMLFACYALFGMSVLATAVMLPMIFFRLLSEGPLPPVLTPSLLLVLGPLGQSVTAVNALGGLAAEAGLPQPHAGSLEAFGVVYGVPVLGFALLWLALAGALTACAARAGMGFAMTWWAFTFPVGTCVTAAGALAGHTGLTAFQWLAAALFLVLTMAWATAACHTLGGLRSGELLAAPRKAA